MKIIVNDANILIDLVDLKILSYFFQLGFEFHTTDIILDELFEQQKEELIPYIQTGKLIVDDITDEDFVEISLIRATKPALSEQDCSAFYQARKENALLLTSDNTLRKYAKANQLEVHGHLWVFDNLINKSIFTGKIAMEKLQELRSVVNPKLGLPEKECRKRIKLWGK